MSRCQEFPPLGFVWNGVSGTDLIQLLKVRRETAESEKEERRKAKRMLKKSRKHDHITQSMRKENHKKQRIEDKNKCEHQHKTKGNKVQDLEINRTSIKRLEAERTELQLKELFENWVPPPITRYQQTEFDDLHWLFDTRVSTRQTIETSTPASFPFYPIAGVCAMPYTLLC